MAIYVILDSIMLLRLLANALIIQAAILGKGS